MINHVSCPTILQYDVKVRRTSQKFRIIPRLDSSKSLLLQGTKAYLTPPAACPRTAATVSTAADNTKLVVLQNSNPDSPPNGRSEGGGKSAGPRSRLISSRPLAASSAVSLPTHRPERRSESPAQAAAGSTGACASP